MCNPGCFISFKTLNSGFRISGDAILDSANTTLLQEYPLRLSPGFPHRRVRCSARSWRRGCRICPPRRPWRIQVKGHLNLYITPKAVARFRDQVRQLTRRPAGVSLPALVARLTRYLRGWGEYFKRAQCSGVLDRLDLWVARRVRAYVAKRWRNALWRRYPDQYLYGTLGLTRLYTLRRDYLRDFTARHGRQPRCRA